MNDFSLWVLLTAVLSIGIFIQAAAGFAAGLLIVSVLSWYGYPIPEAQAALIVATIPQNLLGMWQFRKFVPWRQIMWPATGRLLFMPIGIEALHWLELVSVETLKQIVGGIVLMVTLSVCFVQPTPRPTLHKAGDFWRFRFQDFCKGWLVWAAGHGDVGSSSRLGHQTHSRLSLYDVFDQHHSHLWFDGAVVRQAVDRTFAHHARAVASNADCHSPRFESWYKARCKAPEAGHDCDPDHHRHRSGGRTMTCPAAWF